MYTQSFSRHWAFGLNSNGLNNELVSQAVVVRSDYVSLILILYFNTDLILFKFLAAKTQLNKS